MKSSRTLSYVVPAGMAALLLLAPSLGYCDVENTLRTVQTKLIFTIMPLIGGIAVCFAGFSFFTGNPGARTHLMLALAGALICFLAPQLIVFVQGLIR